MAILGKKIFWSAAAAAILGGAALYGCIPRKPAPALPTPLASVPVAQKGFSVFAAGDIAECGKLPADESGAAKTAALIASNLAPGEEYAVLALGDTSYPVGAPVEYTNCYEPTWGRFKSRTYPTPGNHEYYSPAAYGYYSYFGKMAGPGRRGYYSFDIGDWHFVSLNSVLKPAEQAAQLEWLADDLKRNRSACTLAFWHHPRFTSGGHGNNEWMHDAWQVLSDAHADIVLAGHDHNYERFVPLDRDGSRDDENGIRSFVVGTGGAKLTPMLFKKWNSEILDNNTHGVLRLELRRDSYSWEFLPVAGSDFTDRGAARCHRK